MKVWKRNLLIVYLACTALLVVFFYIYMLNSLTAPFLKFLLFVLGLAVIAGLFVGVYVVIYAFTHEHATLHAGPDGAINIERSALESTARRAMTSIPDVYVQNVRANVIERKGGPVIDFTVTAIPLGAESLMVTAGRIQSNTKQAVEAFTDHEVRYVAVNFVEPKKRADVAAAKAAVDANVASGHTSAHNNSATFGSQVGGASKGVEDPRPSLWDRAKARAEKSRSRRDEDVVETEAVVETVETKPEVVEFEEPEVGSTAASAVPGEDVSQAGETPVSPSQEDSR